MRICLNNLLRSILVTFLPNYHYLRNLISFVNEDIIKTRENAKNYPSVLGIGAKGAYFYQNDKEFHLKNTVFLNISEKKRTPQAFTFLNLIAQQLHLYFLGNQLDISVVVLNEQQEIEKNILRYIMAYTLMAETTQRLNVHPVILDSLERAEKLQKFANTNDIDDIPESVCVEALISASSHHNHMISVLLGRGKNNDISKLPLTNEINEPIKLGEYERTLIPPCPTTCQAYAFAHAFWSKVSGYTKQQEFKDVLNNIDLPPKK